MKSGEYTQESVTEQIVDTEVSIAFCLRDIDIAHQSVNALVKELRAHYAKLDDLRVERQKLKDLQDFFKEVDGGKVR